MKFEQLVDADFVASRSSTKEQAFAGRRGHLPLLEEEVQYFVERELPLTWVSLEDREGDDEPTLRQRSALRNMVNKTRPNAARDSAGQVLVRIAPVRQGYFGTPGFRCMYAILLEKFLAPETDEVCHATLCNLAANPHVKGLLEVRQPDGPFNKIWTENHGDGHNGRCFTIWSRACASHQLQKPCGIWISPTWHRSSNLQLGGRISSIEGGRETACVMCRFQFAIGCQVRTFRPSPVGFINRLGALRKIERMY